MERVCVVCSTDISHKKRDAIYCSQKCRTAPRFRGTYCLECKQELSVSSSHKFETKYCSIKCAERADFCLRNPDFNENYFSQVEIVNSYWAGFIAADGCIYKRPKSSSQLQIGLSAKDADHLKNFKIEIGAGTIAESVRRDQSGKGHPVAAYNLYSDKVCDDLAQNFNILPRKSLTLKPPNIHNECARAFIAGYIDGDGCYARAGNRPQIHIAGTEMFLEWVAQVYNLKKLPLKFGASSAFQMKFNGDDAIRMRSSFKSLDLPLLERKTNRWEELNLDLKIRKDAV